jgi:hypothetical protein
MAKSASKASGLSRVRFIMVEAETDGDLTQITQAIQNAVRPTPIQARISAVPVRTNATQSAPENDNGTTDLLDVEPEDEREAPVERVRSSNESPRAPRKFRSPEVLELDLATEPPFAQFAAEKNPSSHQMRYLTVAAWFKVHRGVEAITADHVYTCYRAVKWPTDVPDFAQPLRDLKGRQLLHLKEKGHYAINHLGLQEVENLAKS